MTESEGRRRQGLGGLPVNSDEVWMFDGARAGTRMSDLAALILAWIAVGSLAFIAIWGRSVILGVLGVLALAMVLRWTVTKWRDHADALRMEREAAGEGTIGG